MSRAKERAEVRAHVTHLIETEGLIACVEGAIQLCRDKDAPANARAQVISSLMRANGLFAASPNEAPKEPHEMTMSELKAFAAQLERDREALLSELKTEGEEGDVFE